ncbi:MAG: cell wall metabolism sensor histidine kinase WalK [Clostridia bacterium]|nr:cell wall metabolism sensor histidine kinase WalK [Clostridia bacterium]MCI9413053.1 cell wall metabolism sensor histidine kinase WalK [Clostridia bacterium]
MIKNIQTKIILIFFVLGVLIIGLLSFSHVMMVEKMSQSIIQGNSGNSLELSEEQKSKIQEKTKEQIQQTEIISVIAIGSFSIIMILVGYFNTKSVVNPVNSLIESAEKIANGEEVEIAHLDKKKTQIDELVNAFSLMTKELKQNLNEMGKQKKQIETILLHMTDGIIAFDMEGKIIHINPAAKSLLQLDRQDNNFNKIFQKLNADINLEKIVYLENWTSSEQRLNIGEKYVNLLFAPFQDENDKPAGVIGVIQDITQHVKLDNMQKEFVADVSHELKTPITSIMGYADTLLESEYDKEMQAKFLGVISSEARRMARLVTDLLVLSRYDNKKITKEEVEFDLGDLTKKCIERLKFEVEKKNHHIECFVTANVPPVKADKYGIERVILNIITNAIKYTPENGMIKVYVGFVYNDAYIKIIDNGIGIPEQDLSRIFERFYRVDKARTREMGGTGLGLSIAKEILDQNNGSIDIKSEVGKGTEIVIRVPTKKLN